MIDSQFFSVSSSIPRDRVAWLIARLFDEDWVRGQLAEAPSDPLELFKFFMRGYSRSELSPHPYFDPNTVRRRFEERGLKVESASIAVWVELGLVEGVNPSSLVDLDFFDSKQPEPFVATFCRYLQEEESNAVSPNDWFAASWYLQRHGGKLEGATPFTHFLVKGYEDGLRPNPDFVLWSKSAVGARNAQRMLTIGKLVDSYYDLKNSVQQPKVGNSPTYLSLKQSVGQISAEKAVKIVLVIPRCGIGGAARLAGILCFAIERLMGLDGLVLIRADDELFLRPKWFPKRLRQINLQDFTSDLNKLEQSEALLSTLRVLNPELTICMNSLLAWDLICDRAAELKTFTRLAAYDFCYSVTKTGKKAGFPVSHVPRAIDDLDLLILDNQFLKDDLAKDHGWDSTQCNKVVVFYTPMDEPKDSFTWILPDVRNARRLKIFWAGRFDRQKRIDVAIEISKRNPQWEFHAWGQAMLDRPLNVKALPANFIIHPPYTDIDELPFDECDLWLYTAEWDGIPQQLIELGLRAVPVVSSKIWGISELINEKTAFPVEEIYSISAYEVQIRNALSSAALRRARGLAFRDWVKAQHSYAQYDQSVRASLDLLEVL